MNHQILDKKDQNEVSNLFNSAFSAAEGEEEGLLVGNLASKLSSEIDHREIICLGTRSKDLLIGAVFFTHLRFRSSARVYMLAPVAVDRFHWKKGVGQALILDGLDRMKNQNVSTVITYGDPSFYSKVGFLPLQESVIQAPLKLSMPEGWQGLSLTGKPIQAMDERPACVEPFDNPVYW